MNVDSQNHQWNGATLSGNMTSLGMELDSGTLWERVLTGRCHGAGKQTLVAGCFGGAPQLGQVGGFLMGWSWSMPNRVRGKVMFLFVYNLLLWPWRGRHALLDF